MKFLFKPFALIATTMGKRFGKDLFRSFWQQVDTGEPPKPTNPDAGLHKIVAAAALEAAAVAGASAMADRAAARTFHYLTGYWPGGQSEEDGKKKG